MYKLNNNAWGLGVFLVYIFIFIFAIFIVTILVNKYNIGKYSENIMMTNEKKISEYEQYENEVEKSAITYRQENYPYLNDGENYRININLLDISNQIKNRCTGYVIIEKQNGVYRHTPYLNCDN